jgi:hypothetical protein
MPPGGGAGSNAVLETNPRSYNKEPTKTPVPRLSEAERAGQSSTSGANLSERIRRLPVRLVLREVTQMEFLAGLVSGLMRFVLAGHMTWN